MHPSLHSLTITLLSSTLVAVWHFEMHISIYIRDAQTFGFETERILSFVQYHWLRPSIFLFTGGNHTLSFTSIVVWILTCTLFISHDLQTFGLIQHREHVDSFVIHAHSVTHHKLIYVRRDCKTLFYVMHFYKLCLLVLLLYYDRVCVTFSGNVQ